LAVFYREGLSKKGGGVEVNNIQAPLFAKPVEAVLKAILEGIILVQ
jgi:hypothetical protein